VLGLLALSTSNNDEGQRLLVLAANQRIENFERVIKANFEGFQVADLVDKIVISAGLSVAAKSGSLENFNLMLRGGEFLNRGLRDRLGDIAVLLGSQSDEQSRRHAHSYLHLLREKRDWELDKITKLLANDTNALENKGALVGEYIDVVKSVSDIEDWYIRASVKT
jgi:hypothetical protein